MNVSNRCTREKKGMDEIVEILQKQSGLMELIERECLRDFDILEALCQELAELRNSCHQAAR